MSPNFSMDSFARIHVAVDASWSTNQAFGSFSLKTTVYLSGVSIFSTASSRYRLGLPLMERKRSYEYFTSSAVSSRPFTGGLLCQRTSLRSLKTYVVSFDRVQDSATSGSIG